jgi:PTS system N-acetylgalactosamine-specific IIA component
MVNMNAYGLKEGQMRYMLLVGHARLPQALKGALEMLMGERDYLLCCSMEEGVGLDQYAAKLDAVLSSVGPDDEVVLIADTVGGSPAKVASAALGKLDLKGACAFGGAKLAMVIAASMAIEDEVDLETIAESVVAEGSLAVRRIS